MENVGQASIFPQFSSFIKLSQKFEEKLKKLAWPRFEGLILENVGQANFFHHFRHLKTSSEIAGKLAGSRFSRVIDGKS